jgi:60 kDa SS-A/Ro ribonucleoprotein
MTSYGSHFSTLKTAQTSQARGDQVKNNAGGFVFALDIWARLERFLILGSEGGTYYVGEKELTVESAKVVLECLKADGARTVETIVAVSDAGRAPKNDPAIFALAIASGAEDPRTRALALAALPKVCRIGTHLFKFVDDVEGFRKWGRGLRNAVSRWYNEKTAEQVGFQAVKYAQREGWSHRDVLRKAHPTPISEQHGAVYRYVTGGFDSFEKVMKHGGAVDKTKLPRVIEGFERLKAASTEAEVISLVREYRLPHECVDGKWKSSPKVWEALLPEMGQTALIRNLGKMTSTGLFGPMGDATKLAAKMLVDKDAIKRGRVHPMAILIAQGVYAQGHGDKGSLAWQPAREIVDALDEAFYAAFDTIEPTGKNHFLGLDISGSMTSAFIANTRLSACQASAAMAMVTARAEQNYFMAGFTAKDGSAWGGGSSEMTPMTFAKNARLDAVMSLMHQLSARMGRTDCALPMLYAAQNKIEVDVFVTYTDSETWAGTVHPFQALKDYRQKMGRPAKMIVVGMTSTEFTIADPSDGGSLDVIGFDAAAPAVMADFARS